MIAEKLGFAKFAGLVQPSITIQDFHANYYRLLEAFAKGDIRKVIITMPPQHGKSLGSSILLPAYMLGHNPDLKIAIASYSGSLASRFNRRIQRIIDSKIYNELFPDTTIKSNGRKNTSETANYVRTADHFEVINHEGELLSVGREGSITGNQVDVFIIDDLYKDAMEGNSPVVRENCWEWYTSVVKTRMHNDSAELIVFTRWHEDDVIGMISKSEKVVKLESFDQLNNATHNQWLHLNLEAIKESKPTEIDPRLAGEALWPERQNLELLKGKRRLDTVRFACMYQGRPSAEGGLLYGHNIMTYESLPTQIVKIANYTDTADTGDDYLCSICYAVSGDGIIYITDVTYTREPMEITETLVAQMLDHNSVRVAYVESNNGGRGFARAVGAKVPHTSVEWFHQSGNKEARILSNSATVLQNIRMPREWSMRWSDLHAHLTSYRRQFSANRWHDAPDVLTGIIEHELTDKENNFITGFGFM